MSERIALWRATRRQSGRVDSAHVAGTQGTVGPGSYRIAGARVLVMYLVQVAKHLPEILRSRTLRAADEGMSGKVYTFRVLGKQVRLEGSELWSRPRDLRAYRVLSSPQGAT